MDISEDQLAIEWTLTEQDIQFVFQNSRGQENRICFAADLCITRAHHRFLERNESLPLKATNYLSQQLDYTPILTPISFSLKSDTYLGRKKIMDYLGLRELDEFEKMALQQWLETKIRSQVYDRKLLIHEARNYLKTRQIMLPASTVLGRLLARVTKETFEKMYEHIVYSFPESERTKLDSLLSQENGMYANLVEFKRSPSNPNAKVILNYLDYFEQLESLGIMNLNLSSFHPDVIENLAKMGKHYSVHDLKQLASQPKRYAILVCFLFETAKNILDLLVKMNSELLTEIQRKARNEVQYDRTTLSKKSKGKLKEASHFIRCALQNPVADITLAEFIKGFNHEQLFRSADICDAIETLEESGLAESIATRLHYLRRYTKRFLSLDFEAAKGSKSLLKGVEILKKYQTGTIKKLPDNVPIRFLPKMWKDCLYDASGKIQPLYWEMGVYYALKKTLASGDIFLSKSRHHKYFWDTVYEEKKWEKERGARYDELGLPKSFDIIGAKLNDQFTETADFLFHSFKNNPFVRLEGQNLVLSKDDALEISPEVNKLRKLFEAHMPSIRIEELIAEVDKYSDFTKAFKPFHEQYRETHLPKKSIYAAIIAHATNIGLYGMGNSAIGISTDMIRNASQIYLRPETIVEGSSHIIKFHLSYPISNVLGDRLWSSSDGQRYGIQASSLMSSYYPRFFGYYDQAISLYTHIADTFDVFSTHTISCSEREAAYVLSGLLSNKSIVNPQFHSTDTHGFTEHIFALCYLLGFSFCPRLKDLTEQRLYKLHKSQNYGEYDCLFSGTVDIELIQEHWDQIIRIIAALKNGHIPAHIIIQKLANRTDKVAKAVQALGRLIKTIYILRYLSDQELRYKVHLQLNRGESRHNLAKALFFDNRGVFKTNDYEEIMNKASCLSLLSNAVLLWNTNHMQRIVEKLREQGMVIKDEHLAKISPLMFKHIQIHGTYHFDRIEDT